MNSERRPAGRERGQIDSGAQCSFSRLAPRLTREILISDVGGIADDSVEPCLGVDEEEVGDEDSRSCAGLFDTFLCLASGLFVQLDTDKLRTLGLSS